MAITFVADNEYNFNGTSQVVTIPTGWAVGDLLVMVSWHYYTAYGIKGWLQRPPINVASTGWLSIKTRVAESGDTTWTQTYSTTERGCIWIGAYTGGAVAGEFSFEELAVSTSMVSTVGVPNTEGLTLYIGAGRDSASMALATGTGTTRASIVASFTTFMEMVVTERTVSGAENATFPTWTSTTAPQNGFASAQLALLDGSVAGETYTPFAFAGAPDNSGWIYKGRNTSTEDSTGVA